MARLSGPDILLPFGIHSPSFWSVDYEPVFPWSGFVIAGIGIGGILYPGGLRAPAFPRLPDSILSPLAVLGRHSLAIYLVHQPAILLILQIITGAHIFW